MKIAAIMQPHYLPWVGYFHLFATADVFVFFDDQRFSPRSWHHRNQIWINGQATWLSVPVKGGREQPIYDCVVDDGQPWRQKHVRSLCLAYAWDRAGDDVADLVQHELLAAGDRLSEINIHLVIAFAAAMGIKTPWLRSSDIETKESHPGTKSGRAIDICRAVGADTLLNAQGAREFIEEEGLFAEEGIDVIYPENPPEWPRLSIAHTAAVHGFDEAARMSLNLDQGCLR